MNQNLKIIFLSLFFFNFANAAIWVCEVQEKPDTIISFDSAQEVLWLQTPESRIDLVTTQRISSWQMAKDKCDVRGGFDQGNNYDMFSMTFRCSFKLGGSFQFDFKALEGYYLEDLYQGGNRNLYNFKNCRK